MEQDSGLKYKKIYDVIFALPISSWKFIERGLYQTAINGIVINLRFAAHGVGNFEVDPPQYLYFNANTTEERKRMDELVEALKKNENQTLDRKIDYIFSAVVSE